MAKQAGLGGLYYFSGRALETDISQVDRATTGKGQIAVPTLSNSAMERISGHSFGALDVQSWFDDATGFAHTAFSSLTTTDQIATWCLSSTRGDPACSMVSKQTNYDPTRGADGTLLFAVNSLSSGFPLEWGVTLTAGEDTHASAGSTASIDSGASSSNGAAAYLQIRELDSGTVTVTVEDSTDNAAWATLVSFSAVADGSEPTAERVTVAGTVNRYLRVTTTGTFTNADIVVMLRRGVSQDDTAYA